MIQLRTMGCSADQEKELESQAPGQAGPNCPPRKLPPRPALDAVLWTAPRLLCQELDFTAWGTGGEVREERLAPCFLHHQLLSEGPMSVSEGKICLLP